MSYKKGDIVKINGIVKPWKSYFSGGSKRDLRRFKCNISGIVLGYSFLKTGTIKNGPYGEAGIFTEEKSHKVFVIEPIEQEKTYWAMKEQQCKIKTNRYLKPIYCFEDDLEMERNNGKLA